MQLNTILSDRLHPLFRSRRADAGGGCRNLTRKPRVRASVRRIRKPKDRRTSVRASVPCPHVRRAHRVIDLHMQFTEQTDLPTRPAGRPADRPEGEAI